MNWIDRLNQSVEYIEDNLDKEIDISTVSRIADCIPWSYSKGSKEIRDLFKDIP